MRAVASESALRFVGAATLEGLTGQRVLTELFEPGAALEHIQLTRWADAVVVCPCTANTLNKFAAGLADDLVGALFLAHDRAKPFLVAPAMNPAMWQHPATQDSVEKLGRWGVRFISVGEGRTACGEVGEGRLAEAPDIVAARSRRRSRGPGWRLRVLVTSGATSEPLDGVRVLSNTGTGTTGSLIAARMARAGPEVVLLRARTSAAAAACREELFTSFADLERSPAAPPRRGGLRRRGPRRGRQRLLGRRGERGWRQRARIRKAALGQGARHPAPHEPQACRRAQGR